MEEGSCSDAVPRNQLNTTDKSGVVLSVFGVGYAFFRFVGELSLIHIYEPTIQEAISYCELGL